ncbi:MAG: hypothetical protein PVH07_09885 [Chloroflexota bacterium]|jgi:hypothetical protein
MRTLRLMLASAVIHALAVGTAGIAIAQDEEDVPVTATQVTGEATGTRTVSPPTGSEVDGVWHDRDLVFEHDIEWSDPRLPSLMRGQENQNWHVLPDDSGAVTFVTNIRLEGESGAWTGAEYGLGEMSDEGLVLQPRMMLLTGEGAFEGLSAVLQRQHEVITAVSSPVFEGYIFEGGLPPMPEPYIAE